MRPWLALAIVAGAWPLALIYYSESGGMQCNDTCSTAQGLARIAVVALPVVLIVAIVRSGARRLDR